MRSTLPVRRRAGPLYAGVVLFVLLTIFTARTVWRAWEDRAGQARTAAVFELVQQRMPSRPVEAPGAIAWLREQLTAYRSHLEPRDAVAFDRLAHETDRLPPELARAADVMRTAIASAAPRELPRHEPFDDGGASRRVVSLWSADGSTFVVTRRHGLETDGSSNEFVTGVLHPMASVRARLDDALRGVARPVRLYALGEDGTLVSLPWPSSTESAEDAARSEARQLSARPTLPSFAPEEFFFRFTDDERDSTRYSGFYVDLGGRGLVSTLTMPMPSAESSQAGVLALDLSHAIDWDNFAATIPPPLAASIVHTRSDSSTRWTTLRAALSDAAPSSLRAALDDAVKLPDSTSDDMSPITHAVVPGSGAVAAFHVSDGAWLLTFFPSAEPSFPGGAVALLGAVLVVLLIGFEVNRRRAEREADRAARALGEKQNLLNTMQVPLLVVDPNTDEIVSANQVAESIGIRRGARFAERISPEPRARAHYERNQVATGEARRAYGVPIRIETRAGETSDQFAIVRSVAVTAPIEALDADERHRLAILFLVDPRSDLRLLIEDVESAAHTDERRRLAGLLSHGLDSLADVLRRSLAGPAAAGDLPSWLAEYLQRRIHVTAWLLDHWDQPLPPHDSVVDAGQARETLNSLERILDQARCDGDLRARLGWANGPLSGDGEGPPFTVSLDWPDEFVITLPVRGGLGFFLTEVLSNAMRHGAPGSPPHVGVGCDRVKKELAIRVTNVPRDNRLPPGSTYGGLALLAGMARLFGWRDFCAAPESESFVVSWRVPLQRRDQPGKPD